VVKRTVVRLLMVGIPFCFSYIAMRPAPAPAPARPTQTFVMCAWDAHGEELTIATDKAACETRKQTRDAVSRNPLKNAVEPAKSLTF
jgi:hypothetical protein